MRREFVPIAGVEKKTRAPGAGRKPLPQPRNRLTIYVTESEREAIQNLIKHLRGEGIESRN